MFVAAKGAWTEKGLLTEQPRDGLRGEALNCQVCFVHWATPAQLQSAAAVGEHSPCERVPIGQREKGLPSDHWVLGGAASVRRGAGR